MKTALIAAVLGMLGGAQATAAPCLANGTAITGRFEWASLTAPRGKPIPAPFIVLDEPVCVQGGGHGRRVALALKDDTTLGHPETGALLTVSGDYDAPKPDWNTADIVAANAVIVSRP